MINSKNQKDPSDFEGGPGKSKWKTQLLRKRVICLADFWAPPLHLRWHFSWKVWENLYTLQTFWKKLVICSCFYQKSIFLRRKSQKMTGRTSYYVFWHSQHGLSGYQGQCYYFFDFLTSLGIVLGVCIRNWHNLYFWASWKTSKMSKMPKITKITFFSTFSAQPIWLPRAMLLFCFDSDIIRDSFRSMYQELA